MRTFQYIAALGAIVSSVAAAPVRGGDFIINTVTEIETVTEILTATVWVDAPSSTSTTSTQVVPTQVPAATTTSTPPVIAITTPSSTSIYVAPVVQTTPTTTATTPATTPTTTAIPTTTTLQQAAVVQTPATTPTYVAPAPTTTTTTPAAAAVTTQSSSSSSSGAKTYTGDVTYYDVGLGSCGNTNSDSEMVLAMAVGVMNKATMCGKTITISYGGSTHTGTIVDTCMGCADGAIDLSPALFKAVVPNGDGRVSGVQWWFN